MACSVSIWGPENRHLGDNVPRCNWRSAIATVCLASAPNPRTPRQVTLAEKSVALVIQVRDQGGNPLSPIGETTLLAMDLEKTGKL